MALNQFRSSSGRRSLRASCSFGDSEKTRIQLFVYVALRHSDTGSGTTTFIRLPDEIWQHGVSINTAGKRDS
jgi:hypothetical protein